MKLHNTIKIQFGCFQPKKKKIASQFPQKHVLRESHIATSFALTVVLPMVVSNPMQNLVSSCPKLRVWKPIRKEQISSSRKKQ